MPKEKMEYTWGVFWRLWMIRLNKAIEGLDAFKHMEDFLAGNYN